MAWHTRPELQPGFVNSRMRAYLAGLGPVPSGSLTLANRIAFIGSKSLGADLAQFAAVEMLAPGREAPAVDVLLIAGDWPKAGEPWREALLNPADAAALRRTIALYRSRGTPSVLWLTGEADAAEALLHLKDAVDAVFVPHGMTGGPALDAGVNVKLFNPFRGEGPSADAAFFRFLVDGAHELADAAQWDMLAPFLPFNSWLIDSSYHYQIPNMKLPAVWRRRFLGHVDTVARAAATKMAYGVFLPDALSRRRPAHFRRRAREAAACKTLVFTDAAAQSGTIRLDASDASATVARLCEDDVARVGLAHRAWREVMAGDSLFERLETIFAAVGIAPVYSEPLRPSINVVMPTLRPELIPFALAMFRAQTYANAELTIVANGVPVPDEIARAIAETPRARLCAVPRDKTLGYCMNYGIDRAATDYWAKWDDDDVYGPHYLEDQMLQRKYLDFDVAGKTAIFNYLEERDCVYARNFAARDAPAAHLGGGTLIVRNGGRYFAEDGRGGEDRAFLHLARERGDRIVAGDPFNFVQVRRADPASHTWTLGAHAQDLRGPRRPGLRLEAVVQ
ncbi:MAG TPA: glycosyltransferase [Rhizomicrobium sp.]|nr:glycosyltransferase [Rhizomicrobium sp.]